MKIFYSPRCLDYAQPGHPESPSRVRATYEYLEERGYSFTEPNCCSDSDILRAHSPELLDSVRKERFFDYDTPIFPGIFEIAKYAAGGAIDAATHCLETGEKSFSLMRPPGHHATKKALGGFCYFNNIAIAALKMKKKTGRVVVVDFDCHHGNGTEDILLGNKDYLYISLHQSPLYPGTGLQSRDNCLNYPLSAGTTPDEYLSVLREALKEAERFDPSLIAVSAGFDTYRHDPITSFTLEQGTYRQIGIMLAAMKRPLFSILEGGYSRDLPECIYQFLMGLEELTTAD